MGAAADLGLLVKRKSIQNDPRFENDPSRVRDPGNSQENDDTGATNGAPFDPQKLKAPGKNPRRFEDSPQNFFQRMAIRAKTRSA